MPIRPGLIHGHDGFPVYVDSPLAVEATDVFHKNMTDCYDEKTKKLVERGVNPISFPGLYLSITSEESKAINFDAAPKVIISASGMCDAGRIRHHLKHNLWRRECSVVFAGYQAAGTLGRVLLDGAETIKLFGEEIHIQAHIETMAAMSSHADQSGLLNWISAFSGPSRVFLVHGNDESMETLSGLIQEQTGFATELPCSGSIFNLATNQWISVTSLVPAQKPARTQKKSAYDQLLAAYNKLLAAVKANQNGANKDLAKFTDQILSLYQRWIR